MHTTRRSVYRKCGPQKPVATTRSSAIITNNQTKDQQNEVVTTTKDLASHNHVMPQSIPLSQSRGIKAGVPESASSISRSNESSKPDTTPRSIHDPNQYRDIHSFLGASIPPMTHLMDAFIDFGCTNADFLLAISSWSSERTREALDQLSLGPNDRKFTEMEKFILENHFKEYFAQK
jgi:hypothetical protein